MVHSGLFECMSKPNGNEFHVSISAEMACKIHPMATEDGILSAESRLQYQGRREEKPSCEY